MRRLELWRGSLKVSYSTDIDIDVDIDIDIDVDVGPGFMCYFVVFKRFSKCL